MLRAIVGLRDLVAGHPLAFMVLWWVGLVALAPLSLLPSTAPPTGIGGVELSLDKLLHVVAYGGLAGIPMLAVADFRRRATAVGAVMAYEIGQEFAPGRSFGYGDLAANLAGVALGVGAGWLARKLPARASG